MSEQLGRYVRVEGYDGAGKTTQVSRLKQYSQEKGIDTVFLREPGGTDFGARIRTLILDKHDDEPSAMTEFLLFTADRNHSAEKVILPALDNDQLVVGDRGLESTVCYQAAAGGLSFELIMNLSRQVLPPRYVRPDALAILSISKELSRKRLGQRFMHTPADRIESKEESYSDRVHSAYQSLGELDYATTIDASLDEDQVFDLLKPIVFDKYLRDHTGIYMPTYSPSSDVTLSAKRTSYGIE